MNTTKQPTKQSIIDFIHAIQIPTSSAKNDVLGHTLVWSPETGHGMNVKSIEYCDVCLALLYAQYKHYLNCPLSIQQQQYQPEQIPKTISDIIHMIDYYILTDKVVLDNINDKYSIQITNQIISDNTNPYGLSNFYKEYLLTDVNVRLVSLSVTDPGWSIVCIILSALLNAGYDLKSYVIKDCLKQFLTFSYAPYSNILQMIDNVADVITNTNTDELDSIIQTVLSSNDKAVNEYKAGKEKVLGSLIGQVMKLIKADPTLVREKLIQSIKMKD